MNLVPAICFVFAFVVVLTSANEPNDYTNGNFAVPSVPKREILKCMGKFTSLSTYVYAYLFS